MHIVAHVSQHYTHEPVPSDFDTTTPEFDQALKSGLVKHGAKGGYLVRVTRKSDTQAGASIGENEILQRVLHHALPQNGSQVFTRKEAAADYFTIRVLPELAHPSWVTKFDVHVDGAVSEEQFRAFLKPYVEAKHARSGEPIVPPEMIEPLVKAYLEPFDADALAAHLHAKFKLPAPSATKAVQS